MSYRVHRDEKAWLLPRLFLLSLVMMTPAACAQAASIDATTERVEIQQMFFITDGHRYHPIDFYAYGKKIQGEWTVLIIYYDAFKDFSTAFGYPAAPEYRCEFTVSITSESVIIYASRYYYDPNEAEETLNMQFTGLRDHARGSFDPISYSVSYVLDWFDLTWPDIVYNGSGNVTGFVFAFPPP